MECTLSVTEAVEKFVTNIKKKYKGRRIIRKEQLLCCRSEKLVRLELAERERLQGIEQRGSGNKKVVRTPLTYTDLFKVESGKKEIKKILVDGDAGIGKTTFCTTISEKWANGEIFKEFELLVLLPLRQQEVASAGSLLDLLMLLHPSNRICELVKEYFEEDEGKILVVADGWDELSKEKRDKGSFLYKFLFGELYYSMSTVVTSRHSASASLHHLSCIDRFAEVRGFDKEHIVEYINSEFASDQKQASDLLEKLENNPLIESICSVPLNCAIICHLWQTLKGDLPITLTGIYTQIILNIILRNIRKFSAYYSENVLNLSSFDDLPESLQQSWWLLCKFAFQALKKDQLVFSDKELKDFFPQGLAFGESDSFLCFGLLESSVSSLAVGCGRSFHFLHLTFQEYLAALFLVKQECDSQIVDSSSLISNLTSLYTVEGPHSIVSRFCFGIVFSFEMFRSSIGQRILTMFPSELYSYNTNRVLSHFLWAFEAQNEEFAHIIADYCRRFCLNPSNAHESMAIAYVISITADLKCNGIAIDFHLCGLHDSNIMALTDALAGKDGKLQVKSLNLFGNKLTDGGVTDLFHRASAAFQSLECLNLGGNRIRGDGVNSALTTLAKSRLKVEFYFYDNRLEVSSLIVFRDGLCHHQLSNLMVLCLEGSLSSDADTNAELILALGNCSDLRVLNLSRNNLHVPGGRALGKILPKLYLDELKVSEAMLGDEGMAALVENLDGNCDIRELDLGTNDIHAAGVLYLAESVYEGKIVIEDALCLDNNSLCWEGAIDLFKLLFNGDFQISCLSLQRCKLTTIGGNNDKCITYSGIREFIRSLITKANSVEEIYLSDSFTGECIHVLAGLMCLCPHLEILDCTNCLITSDDLKQLLSLLSQLKFNHLKTWVLCQNYLDDDGASALIEQMPMFPSLTHIEVDSNQLSTEVHTMLDENYKKRQRAKLQSKLEQRRQLKYGCGDGAIMRDSSPVLAHEDGAGTGISCQYSMPDSVELTTLEPHHVHQEVQRVETIIAEDKVSSEISDSENSPTPPSSPAAKRMKLQEDESVQSILEAQATEDMSSPDVTGFREGRTVANEEVDHGQLHPIVESERTATPGLQLNDVNSVLGEVTAHQVEAEKVVSYEDESEHSALEAKAAEEMSSFGEGRSGEGEEVDQLHPRVDPGRTAITESQLGDVLLVLKEVTRPHQLGIHLKIEISELEKIEKDHPRIERQMTEVIKYWLRNRECSWEVLANAVEKMGGHANLVKRLREKHLEALKTPTKSEQCEV